MQALTIDNLFEDKNLKNIIYKLSSRNNEYQLARSELFFILLKDKRIESLSTYQDQINFCVRILKTQIHSDTSPFHKEFRNLGQPNSIIIFSTNENSRKEASVPEIPVYQNTNTNTFHSDKLLDKINNILNTELPWYDSSLFRLYYLPHPDPHCEKQTYSYRQIEKMHRLNKFKIDHMFAYNNVKKVFEHIIKRLKEDGDLREDQIKNIKTLKIFKDI